MCTILVTVAITYLIFGNKIYKLLDSIQVMTEVTPKEMIEIYKRIDKMTWFLYIVSLLSITNAASRNFYKNDCQGLITDDKRYVCCLINPVWFPFILDDFILVKPFLVVWFDFGQIFILPIYVLTIIGLISVPSFLIARLKHLRRTIDIENLDEFTRNFNFYVRYYTEICG